MQESKYRPACRDAGSLLALQTTNFERSTLRADKKAFVCSFLMACVLAYYFGTNTLGYSSLCSHPPAENKAVILSPLTGGFCFDVGLGSQTFALTLK